MRESIKRVARVAATVAVSPMILSYFMRSPVMGGHRALEGSTQLLAMVPGMVGQYLRGAFLSATIAECHPTATVCFGTTFSRPDARIGAFAYIGPGCHLGLVHIQRDALIGAGVHIPSGGANHGTADLSRPIREQPGTERVVRIGRGAWIGSASVVMADVGDDSIVGAGSVVTRPLPARVVAAGVPARVVRHRDEHQLSAG